MVTVPKAVINRLPMYHRFLYQLLLEGKEKISSQELSQLMRITSSQLRQDLSYFGEFGQQGYGYRVETLYQAISGILGLEKQYTAVIVGAGNIGRAIVNYPGFSRRGLKITGIFDNNPKNIGSQVGNLTVMDVEHLADFLKKYPVQIGIVSTPVQAAQKVAYILMKSGVRGIWNFAPIMLEKNGDVVVEDIHLGDSLLTLFYRLNEKEGKN
ncbi:MAG: redox-sensing transcriptional repressor Rex [Clostridia bacterium]|nr:redox-sensing transcriptional repressor Rex [Clostridia bacterium]